MLDYADIIKGLWTASCAAFLWIWRRLHIRLDAAETRIRDAERELNSHKLMIAENYMTRKEMKEELSEIKAMLNNIYNKLDRKADK